MVRPSVAPGPVSTTWWTSMAASVILAGRFVINLSLNLALHLHRIEQAKYEPTAEGESSSVCVSKATVDTDGGSQVWCQGSGAWAALCLPEVREQEEGLLTVPERWGPDTFLSQMTCSSAPWTRVPIAGHQAPSRLPSSLRLRPSARLRVGGVPCSCHTIPLPRPTGPEDRTASAYLQPHP